ncbi:hypothetical protein BV22DRAFT_1027256, partial [Leucogyrophana mollusca]
MREAFRQTCICGRVFAEVGQFRRHEKGCQKGKKRLSSALAKAREVYQRKKIRIDEDLDRDSNHLPDSEANIQDPLNDMGSRLDSEEPPLPLPPPELAPYGFPSPANSPSPSASPLPTRCQSIRSSLRRFFNTQRNKFGLFRRYHTEHPPSRDPEDPHAPEHSHCALSESDTPQNGAHPEPGPDNPFYPYPNESSLRLGDWYWNHGAQKSQESFKQLLDVIGNPSFSSEDVRTTNWKAIDRELGSNSFDADEEEWVDADGWRRTPITISVPFHSRSACPGPKDHCVVDLHHRSLVSII